MLFISTISTVRVSVVAIRSRGSCWSVPAVSGPVKVISPGLCPTARVSSKVTVHRDYKSKMFPVFIAYEIQLKLEFPVEYNVLKPLQLQNHISTSS